MTRPNPHRRFLLAYALANAGGVIAYSPLLMLLLPARIAVLAGPAQVEWLSLATLLGAITASIAGVGFGWLSDLAGTRRTWVVAGLAATLASYLPFALATTPAGLVAAVIAFQAAVNLLLAPLAAWAADAVPDRHKGVLSGLLGAGPPVGALAGVVATLPLLAGEGARLATVCAMVAALTVPLLFVRAPAREDAPAALAVSAPSRVAALSHWTETGPVSAAIRAGSSSVSSGV